MSGRHACSLAIVVVAMASCAKAKAPHEQWTCPMHPQYISDRPGDCPICGMKLVPSSRRTADPAPDLGGALQIDPQRQRLLGLRTIRVAPGQLTGTIRTTGRVIADETRIHKVTARFQGYIERLHADFTGKRVEKGAPLAAIYSPELLATEEEYLLARRSSAELARSGLPDVAQSARARLALFGIGEGELARLEQRGTAERALTIRAPLSGYVTQKSAIAGAKVAPDDPLFEIVDLSVVWIVADIYEHELPRVRLGQAATVEVSYWPGRSWKGKVAYVYPAVDPKTRTVRVRIDVGNPRTELKPEMFCDVAIATDPRTVLLVPDDAVLDTGTRKVVFLMRGEERLEPRTIEVGLHADGRYEVRAGLAEGDRVAAGASFLLDSESSLRAALSAMTTPGDGGQP